MFFCFVLPPSATRLSAGGDTPACYRRWKDMFGLCISLPFFLSVCAPPSLLVRVREHWSVYLTSVSSIFALLAYRTCQIGPPRATQGNQGSCRVALAFLCFFTSQLLARTATLTVPPLLNPRAIHELPCGVVSCLDSPRQTGSALIRRIRLAPYEVGALSCRSAQAMQAHF